MLLSVCPVLHAFLVTSVGLLLGFARSPPQNTFALRNCEIMNGYCTTFSQRFSLWRVQSAMKRRQLGFPTRSFVFIEALRGGSVLVAIGMTIAFFAGCENPKSKGQADEKGILREPDNGNKIHGEVGAVYGRSG